MYRFKYLLFSLLLLSLLFVSAAFFMLSTSAGLELLVDGVNRFGGDTVSIGRAEGRVSGRFTLEQFLIKVDGVEVSLREISIDWQPGALLSRQLQIARLHGSGLKIILPDDTGQKDTSAGAPARFRGYLPFALFFEDFRLTDIDFCRESGEQFLHLDEVGMQISGFSNRLQIDTLNVQAPDFGVRLGGDVNTGEAKASNMALPFLDRLKVHLKGDWRLAGFGFHPMQGNFLVDGTVERLGLDVRLNFPTEIRVKGQLIDILKNSSWQAKVEAKEVDLSTWIRNCPQIVLTDFTGDMVGDFASYGGTVISNGSWGFFDNLHLRSELQGDSYGIDFDRLRIAREKSFISTEKALISWRDIFSWRGVFSVENFDFSIFAHNFIGSASSHFTSVGDVHDEGLESSFLIDNLNGNIYGQDIAASGAIRLTENGVFTENLLLQSGKIDGTATLSQGRFLWDERSSWGAQIDLHGFNPGWVHPLLSGQLDGSLQAEGRWGTAGFAGSLAVTDLRGQLLENEVRGNGALSFSEDSLDCPGLELQLGQSVLTAAGKASGDFGLDVHFFSPELSELYPELSGHADLTGRLSGSRKQPLVEVTGRFSELQYKTNSIASVRIDYEGGIGPEGDMQGEMSLAGMKLNSIDIEQVQMQLRGKVREHELDFMVESDSGSLSFKANGGYETGWLGNLSDLRLQPSGFDLIEQRGEARLAISEQIISAADFCLSDQENSLCLAGRYLPRQEPSWSVSVDLQTISLSLLKRFGWAGADLDGRISGKFEAEGNRNEVLTGWGRLDLPSGSIRLPIEDEEPLSFFLQACSLNLNLDNKTLQTLLELKEQGGGRVFLDADVRGVGEFTVHPDTMALTGRMDLEKFDLSILSAYDLYWIESTGWVSSSLFLGGTLGKPEFYGDLSLQEGRIELPLQGIFLSEVVLSLTSLKEGVRLWASASSGPGKVEANGTVSYGTTGVEGSLKIIGRDFQLVNLPEYAFRVNPDVQFSFGPDRTRITGRVEVPYGVVAPEELNNSVTVSSDVVVINQDMEELNGSLPVFLDLDVQLGEDVSVDGYGLTGKVGGGLKVQSNPDESIIARGELEMRQGVFSLYGRSLDIERGRILFNGGPIDDPGLDVRAQKTVSDEQAKGEGYTVGVDISGLLQDLQFHLFSSPEMDDTEILSLMVVGHSFSGSTSEESNLLQSAAETLGVAGGDKMVQGLTSLLMLDDLHLEGGAKNEDFSLVLGKRITQDLYIGYDINMFSRLGQFRVRYDLKKGFWVETRSSSESTGADLLYSFER